MSLSRGAAGRALALSYLDDALPGRGYAEAAGIALRRATAGVTAQPLGPGLLQGFTGVAWTIAHLARRARADAEGATAPVDEALVDLLRRRGWPGVYDHVSGVVGVGVYALERLPSPAGAELLELVVGALAARAEHSDGRATWFTRPEELHPDTRERAPDGYYNLGLAHGVPGVTAVLAGAVAAGVDSAAPLLDASVAWLESQVLEDAPALWPFFVGPGVEAFPARLAWCYGDPGVAVALLHAAAVREREDWRALVDRAVDLMLARGHDASGVTGASLCHGSAGLAQLCGRLREATGREELGAMAARWVEHTLALRSPRGELGGFSVWDPGDPNETGGDVQGPGFLAGIAGVALALAGAATDVAPDWDRCLLISLPQVRVAEASAA
ncbi:MAG TPA: lanthionine synthetase LanC family protein [Solirubrobacteraceae bacterium]